MNKKDVEKFLSLVKDQAFGIWIRNSANEEFTFNIEVSEDVELLEDSLIIHEIILGEDGNKDHYWGIINLEDIIYMNSNY